MFEREELRQELEDGDALSIALAVDGCMLGVEDTQESCGTCLDNLLTIFEAVYCSSISLANKMYWMCLVDDNIKDITSRLSRIQIAEG